MQDLTPSTQSEPQQILVDIQPPVQEQSNVVIQPSVPEQTTVLQTETTVMEPTLVAAVPSPVPQPSQPAQTQVPHSEVAAPPLVNNMQLSAPPIPAYVDVDAVQQVVSFPPLISQEIGFHPVPVLEVEEGLTDDTGYDTTLGLPHHSYVDALLVLLDSLIICIQTLGRFFYFGIIIFIFLWLANPISLFIFSVSILLFKCRFV